MKKLILLCAMFVSVTVLFGGCATKDNVQPAVTDSAQPTVQAETDKTTQPTATKELNIYTWAGYIPDDSVQKFEKETGIKVNYSNFSVNDEMYAKLKANHASEYDIVICSDYIIDVMAREGGLLKPLEKEKLANYKNIDPSYQSKYYDPKNEYTIPFSGASALIVYDSEKVPFDITGYADLWKPELKDKVVLLNGDRDVIGFTLQKMGYSVNETDPAILQKVAEELKALKPNVAGFDANTPQQMMISGDATVGYMFGSQVVPVTDAIPAAKVVYPKEGMGFYIDNVVVPLNAPNAENAYKFIDFILDGQNSAAISSSINYMNANLAAKEFLPQTYLDNKTVNIPKEILDQAQVYQDLGDARKTYDEIWTAFLGE